MEKKDYFDLVQFKNEVERLPNWVENEKDLFDYCIHMKYCLFEEEIKMEILKDCLKDRGLTLSEKDLFLEVQKKCEEAYLYLRDKEMTFEEALSKPRIAI